MRSFMERVLGRCVILVSVSMATFAMGGGGETELSPESDQGTVAMTVLRTLSRQHYRDVVIGDSFSARVLQRYLSALDPSHTSLLASDVDEFERVYGSRLDDALLRGNGISLHIVLWAPSAGVV